MMKCGQVIRLISLALVIAFLAGSCGDDQDSLSLSVESPAAYFQLMDPAAATPMVAAHRGYHRNVPENSVASIRAAAKLGADFAEIDVRHTQDGILVLMHDSTVSRTTDGYGEVASTTYSQIQALTLNGSASSDPETSKVPTFAQALATARECRIMLYVDVKSGRDDLVQAAVQAGPYYDVALLYDTLQQVLKLRARDSRLLLMPPVGSLEEFEAVRAAMPDLKIVELAADEPRSDLCAAIRQAGIKVQQDVMKIGDVPAMLLDSCEGWKPYIDAGVWLLQTDEPALLVPAVAELRSTGVFPD